MNHARPALFVALAAALLTACATEPVATPQRAPSAEAARIKHVIATTPGDPARGHILFAARCGRCHTLNDAGGKLGPDLTHYARDAESLDFLIAVIVDPQREVHDYHTTFEVTTTDGRTLTGVILQEGADAMILIDAAGQQVAIPGAQVRSRKPLLNSMMPQTVLTGLTDGQVADVFAYLLKK